MPDLEKTQEELDNEAKKLNDVEIAELANKEIKKRDEEIAQLKRDLAKEKLYSQAEETERETPSREECLKIINNPNVCNYDYAQAVVDLVDVELSEGRQNPLGTNGEMVYDFFKEVIEECEGDKTRFPAIYQAKLPKDDPKVEMAYNKRKQSN